MKKFSLLAPVFAIFLAAPALASEFGAVLTGDTKLACEAIVCLSSSHQPSECSPSLQRYFGIHKKKLGDTIKARKDFLKECPASNESSEMRALTDAIANGAGRCDADYLNQNLKERWSIRETRACNSYSGSGLKRTCKEWQPWQITDTVQLSTATGGIRKIGGYVDSDGKLDCGEDMHGISIFSTTACRVRGIDVISTQKPSYCSVYESTEYVDKASLGVVYVGEPLNGGKWVEKSQLNNN